ncbi:alkaline-phosphatase-like protein [Aspergillus caelatus]|uniref:beta-glucosidase n=1 Tax=Aspergillus caelatus TaxID=61420 RepID=A0A5N7A7D2_9EURO|nr:alkaline-phosphatase-like protein [Aspergillus caelatus]KAE8365757.1 alkaline-phosphatase-like protein [Aspergillus caelatus]
MVGKWHLGEGIENQPTGFDYWSVLPGQGLYWDPEFIEPDGEHIEPGYVTDIITDKSLDWIKARDRDRPFFLMCHHKAPHRSWECDDKHKHLYKDPIRLPDTFSDDYKNRAKAAKIAKMRVIEDLTYQDLGLVQPDGGRRVGEPVLQEKGNSERKIPVPGSVAELHSMRLIDKDDGTIFTFGSHAELAEFKFQRYMQRYLRTIQSIDDNVGRLLDYLDSEPQLADNTIVIYTSDQGFFLGEHGWFDKRFMYEESFQMPLLIRYPKEIVAASVCDDIICNVDFAATWLDYANLPAPSYMQGTSFRPLLQGRTPKSWQQVAYHRYWMHNDIIHHAYAHYGIRNQRYKLIYWYNEPLGVKGARPGGIEYREWELFDCDKDPLELFNVYHERQYQGVVREMITMLEKKMAEIGDEPVHPNRAEQPLLPMVNLQLTLPAMASCHIALAVSVPSEAFGKGLHRKRAEALVDQMTWEEKVAQMGGIRRLLSLGPQIDEENYECRQVEYQNGNIGFGATLNWADEILSLTNDIRQREINESRLHIPFITVTDSINSLYLSGGTIFPSNLAMAATFNIPLFREGVAALREEQLAIGVSWVLSPPLDIAWEPRYSRIGELFGEDCYLTGEFGHAYVQTMQDKDESGNIKVATTVKHFVYGESRGGVNAASMYGGINHLYNDQLRPYMRALEADPAAVMVSYASVDLVPMSANKYLVRDVLREKLGFEGIVMSDAGSIAHLYTESRLADSYAEAALLALEAGLQMELSPGSPAVFPTLVAAAEDRHVGKLINDAVLNILQLKFATGLFDNPLPDPAKVNETLRTPAHLDISRNVTRESIVLLQNDGILPKIPSKVALLGPFADIRNYGSYAPVNSSDSRYGNSLYQSLRAKLGASNVNLVQGVDFIDTNSTNIATAVSAAKEAGLAIVVLGSLSVGTTDPLVTKRTDGEFFTHAELSFPGAQQQLLDAVLDASIPTILVLSGGQPYVLNNSTLRSNAILHSFLGGEFTGDALVEIIMGHVNPSGKLPISLPQDTSATPVFYDYLPSDDTGTADSILGFHSTYQFPLLSRAPSMPFGFGLSYTDFTVSTPIARAGNNSVEVRVNITNSGCIAGKEVVQLYHRPNTTTGIEFPVKRLVRFEKVDLRAGEGIEVRFVIPYKDLGYYVNGKLRVKRGVYSFWAGTSARTEDLIGINVTVI